MGIKITLISSVRVGGHRLYKRAFNRTSDLEKSYQSVSNLALRKINVRTVS